MTIPLPDARERSDEVLEALRQRALRGCQLGLTEGQVAEVLGVAREAVSRWWSAYADHRVQALPHRRTGRPSGSGRALTDTQAGHLQQLLRTHQPEELGIAAPLWARPAVADLIDRQYDLRLAVRTVGRYLRRWGFTAKRPRRHARD
jgi:transposase